MTLLSFGYLISCYFKIRFNIIIRSRKPRLTAVGIRCAVHATPSTTKDWH
jgi:hypothetical protein